MGMQNRTGFQVDDHGHIGMTSPDGDLVNGNIANLPQLPPLESQGKVLFEDVFDHVPPDIEEAGHMLDRGDRQRSVTNRSKAFSLLFFPSAKSMGSFTLWPHDRHCWKWP